ncbi:hypothetical protein LB553_02330 [Mesorhizobium sp. CA8]|nr:hypothetical protein [Mesorhizobium sp. CA8]
MGKRKIQKPTVTNFEVGPSSPCPAAESRAVAAAQPIRIARRAASRDVAHAERSSIDPFVPRGFGVAGTSAPRSGYLAARRCSMNATKEFLRSWLAENVGNLPTDTEISVAMLAQQFEQDADAAGYGREVREQEVGNIEDAIQRALDKTAAGTGEVESSPDEENSLAPVVDALEAAEPKASGDAEGRPKPAG